MILRHLRKAVPMCQGRLTSLYCPSAAQAEALSWLSVKGQHAADQDVGRQLAHQDARAFRAVPTVHDSCTQSGEQPASTTCNKDMIAVFTCMKCETRSAKAFSKQAYEHGVVIVQCPGCKNRHLLADRLGWFGEDGSVEDILARHGQEMKRVNTRDDGTLELSVEDIVGRQSQP